MMDFRTLSDSNYRQFLPNHWELVEHKQSLQNQLVCYHSVQYTKHFHE